MNRGDRMARANYTFPFCILRNNIYYSFILSHNAFLSNNIRLPRSPFVVSRGKFCSVPFQKQTNKNQSFVLELKLVGLSSVYSVCGHVAVIFFFSLSLTEGFLRFGHFDFASHDGVEKVPP